MTGNNRNNNNEITFEIVEHIGVLDVMDNREEKWTKEVNLVAWNGGKPKIDVRDWNSSHERMSRGITLTEDPIEGTKDKDVVYTDVWVSMGEPDEAWEERIRDLSPYQVNAAVMQRAGKDAIFMHCLPAFHDLKTEIGREKGEQFGFTELEVTDEVFESSQSVVFKEAENRMHTIKAIMAATMGAF